MSTVRPGWRETCLGEIADFRNGVNYTKDNFGRGVKVINVKDFKDYTSPKYDSLDEINPEGVVRPAHLLQENDVVFVRSNGNRELIGRSIALLSVPAEPITHSAFTIRARLHHHPEVNPRFFAYVFRSGVIRQVLSAQGNGANISNLNQGILERLVVPFPPREQQDRISSILSAYDDLIENNTRRIAILEEMARRLYDEWFVHFRFPGHERVEVEKGLPKGWRKRPLAEVCSRITDGAHKSPPTSTSGLPMASVKDMHAWGLDLSGCRRISEADFAELVRSSCRPQRNDILVAKDGANLNKHTFLVTEEDAVVLLSSIAILRPSEKVNPEFLVAQLKSEEVSYRIKMMRSGAAIPRIVLKDFKRLEVLIPPCAIQDEWVALAGPMHALCRSLVTKNAILRAQRDLLLPKLVSGEIDVSRAEAMLEAAE